jgi:GntR family transcriptional regulator/MocR family aminotransferase
LIDALCTVRNGTDHRVPLPLQATAAEFIGNGYLGAHIRRSGCSTPNGARRCCPRSNPKAAGCCPSPTSSTGLHLLAELSGGYDDQSLAAAARTRQIGVSPLSGYFVDASTTKRQGLLMGFGNTRAESMKGAIRGLCGWFVD